jgi:hypothetical protein
LLTTPIGVYASWFTTQTTSASSSPLLMNAVSYVVAALPEISLCLDAANALQDLCDANRAALAPHIGAFAEIHAELRGIPVGATTDHFCLVIHHKLGRTLRRVKCFNPSRASFRHCLLKMKSLPSRSGYVNLALIRLLTLFTRLLLVLWSKS